MSLSLNQVLKQTQKLAMTPQMQQSIQLLQLTSMELEQLAQQEIVENPFLEIADETDDESPERARSAESASPEKETIRESRETSAEATGDGGSTNRLADLDVNWSEVYDGSENQAYFPREDEEERDFTEYTARRNSLYDHLLWQLRVSNLNEKDREIGEFLIGNIDNDGYLRVSIEESAGALDVDVRQVEKVLETIQSFDPIGVGARDLKECLLLQVKDRGMADPLVSKVISEHLDLLLRKNLKELAKKLGVREKRLKVVVGLIASLEPHPGRSITKEQPPYVVPDVFVKKVNDKYLYYLNEGSSSHLRISPFYRQLLEQNNFTKEEKRFAVERFRSAIWLIKNIEKRKSTILRVTETILNFQKEFLEKGIEHLRPLTLREIA
jgi:RNA polymerase sigma-54 factor